MKRRGFLTMSLMLLMSTSTYAGKYTSLISTEAAMIYITNQKNQPKPLPKPDTGNIQPDPIPQPSITQPQPLPMPSTSSTTQRYYNKSNKSRTRIFKR